MTFWQIKHISWLMLAEQTVKYNHVAEKTTVELIEFSYALINDIG